MAPQSVIIGLDNVLMLTNSSLLIILVIKYHKGGFTDEGCYYQYSEIGTQVIDCIYIYIYIVWRHCHFGSENDNWTCKYVTIIQLWNDHEESHLAIPDQIVKYNKLNCNECLQIEVTGVGYEYTISVLSLSYDIIYIYFHILYIYMQLKTMIMSYLVFRETGWVT